MTDGPQGTPPGWYPDPSTGFNRYWDGSSWGAYAPAVAGSNSPMPASKDKIAAGLLGIFLGGLGIHKFYLGYTNSGLIMLILSVLGWVFSCFLVPLALPLIFGIVGLIEGIIYLTKSDAEFQALYVQGRREWF